MADWDGYLARRRETFLGSATRFGTPQYILDEGMLEVRCTDLLAAFGKGNGRFKAFYPYKTNSLPYALSIIHGFGIGAEVSSLLELQLAKKLKAADVVFNSAGKTSQELDFAVGSATVIADSIDELGRIRQSAERAGVEPRIGVRLNLNGSKKTELARFGVSSGEFPAFAKELGRLGLRLSGIHFHIGTALASPKPYVKALSRVAEIAKSGAFAGAADELEFIDIGGGIGAWGTRRKGYADYMLRHIEKLSGRSGASSLRAPSYPAVAPIGAFAHAIGDAFERDVRPVFGDVQMWLEPGRWLVAPCFHMLSTVLQVKGSGAVLDGGIDLLPNALHEDYPLANISNYSPKARRCCVMGPLPMSNDILSSHLFGGKPLAGDIVCAMNVGAYNLSWSRQFVKPMARVIAFSQGALRQVRREETLDYRLGRDAPF
jgi:diaminopimelate decarboxylase